jgi:hypothetical protein
VGAAGLILSIATLFLCYSKAILAGFQGGIVLVVGNRCVMAKGKQTVSSSSSEAAAQKAEMATRNSL